MAKLGTTVAPARRIATAAAACGAMLFMFAGAPDADAKSKWVVKGAGFGHGIGMSQYGAYGYAKQGTGYAEILAHYYTGTTLSTTVSTTERVLLKPYQSSVRFSGASSACGVGLSEGATYVAKRKGAGVALRSKKGAKLANCGPLLSATGGDSVVLPGKGTYRGALEIRASTVPGKLNAINAVALEDYIRGIVARESPSSWPLDALRAQAVAARSYALSTGVGGNGFDHYDDTRSQVYGGVGAETARTDQAVADTSLQVVMHQGKVAETYFMSTSGGHTENNENSFLGGTPMPYLRGVEDPFDTASPYHRWNRKFSQQSMQAELGGLVKGKLKRIVVVSRGVSPRVIKANVIGTGGTTSTSGPTLRARLGLPDTWATFKRGGAVAAKANRAWPNAL